MEDALLSEIIIESLAMHQAIVVKTLACSMCGLEPLPPLSVGLSTPDLFVNLVTHFIHFSSVLNTGNLPMMAKELK